MRCYKVVLIVIYGICLAGCTTAPKDGAPKHDIDTTKIADAKPKPLAKSRYGNPKSYKVYGKTYHVMNSSQGYKKRGIASWYGTKFHGRLTSTREPYNMFAMTAASPTLPIPCFVRVTNLANNKSVVVKVNDRGPFAANRIIDLSYAAAKKLGYSKQGTAMVEVTAINMQRPGSTNNAPRLYLQIGAYQQPTNAATAVATVQQLFPHIKTQTTTTMINHRTWYRVQMGPLPSVAESDKLYATLHANGFPKAITVIH